MTIEHPGEFPQQPVSLGQAAAQDSEVQGTHWPADNAKGQDERGMMQGAPVRNPQPESQPQDTPAKDSAPKAATVLVRGETVSDPDSKSPSKVSPAKAKEPAQAKKVSPAKAKILSRLPALDDDADVGAQKEHVVTRDGKADIAFTGALLASAAPPSALKGEWQEYRIYETSGGKYVFSKVSRSVYEEDQDGHEAEVFDPTPSSMPTQLLRSVRDAARSQPLTWKDAAVDFFGYDPLAKDLYRKVGHEFEERIN